MSFPLHCWRYQFRVDIAGADRHNLPDCLEGEELALFDFVDREQAYEQIRSGLWVVEGSFMAPYQAFAHDLGVISAYVFQIVKGVEVAERFVSEAVSDDARAWKVVARQGEWVKFPLVVGELDDGRFQVDMDADDLDVIRAQWSGYPLWFQDGMRRKHPLLRVL